VGQEVHAIGHCLVKSRQDALPWIPLFSVIENRTPPSGDASVTGARFDACVGRKYPSLLVLADVIAEVEGLGWEVIINLVHNSGRVRPRSPLALTTTLIVANPFEGLDG